MTSSPCPPLDVPIEGADLRYRNLSAARAAYNCGDGELSRELSREAHGLLANGPSSPQAQSTWSPWASASEAGHNEELAYKGATLILRGAVDGVIASLVVLSLGDSAGWSPSLTVTMDATLLSCLAAYSAGREALEIVTYKAYYQRERQREAWELDNFPEGEVEEMVQLYNRKGLPEHAARTVVSAMASMPDFFVDVMMLEELQMSPPPSISAVSAAMRICCSMLVCGGALPLVFTLLHRTTSMTPTTTTSHADADVTAYLIVVALAAGALCYLGSLRASITHGKRGKLALQTVALAFPSVFLARTAGAVLLNQMQPAL